MLYFSLRLIYMTAVNVFFIGHLFFSLLVSSPPPPFVATVVITNNNLRRSAQNLSNFICSRAKYDLSFCHCFSSPLNDPIALTTTQPKFIHLILFFSQCLHAHIHTRLQLNAIFIPNYLCKKKKIMNRCWMTLPAHYHVIINFRRLCVHNECNLKKKWWFSL